MSTTKPSIPKGTRDFSPEEMRKRNFIFDTLREIFRKYGYQQIETPAMENLSTLLGKYGEEGDKLLFRILNSGDFIGDFQATENVLAKKWEDFLEKIQSLENLEYEVNSHINSDDWYLNLIINYLREEISDIKKNSTDKAYDLKGLKKYLRVHRYRYIQKRLYDFVESKGELIKAISEKGLRYDLTVPFARYVVQYRNDITFPFKRFQIQPVWRADRPQKGRYREFYQCDVDVVGSDSLLNEAELIQIIDEAFGKMEVNTVVKVNNRKILTGIADYIGEPERIVDITIAIDKLEKVGWERVQEELYERGLAEEAVKELKSIVQVVEMNNIEKLDFLEKVLFASEVGLAGVKELRTLLGYLDILSVKTTVEIDLTLARGLNYYTGAIFEVKALDVEMGSICGGGRYDNLTGIFGMPGVSGVGISFGADRIFDVLNQLDKYPQDSTQGTQVLFINFGEKEEMYCLPLVSKIRTAGINAELFPGSVKMKKQMAYADAKKIPYVALVGDNEMQQNVISLKNMQSGEQTLVTIEELISKFKG